MFNYFANGGSMNGISFNNGNGYARWWTGTATQTSYMLGDEMYGEGDIGVMHSVKVENPYSVKDGFDFFTSSISGYENLGWNSLSVAQKSKLVWDTRKLIKNVTGYRISGNNSSWYRTKIPKTFKNVGRAANVVAVGALVYDD